MILAVNKRASFDYHILQTYQAGLVLSGTMTRLLRNNRVNPQGKFIVNQGGELQIIGVNVESININGRNLQNYQENISLLLKKREKSEIIGRLSEQGLTCIVLNFKSIGRWLKAEIAIVKGKKNYDKRESLKKADMDREARSLGEY
jgi:SsrA-binding protein